ncbi:MAG: hypothetical protein ILP11_03325 [Alphaproteobacteria bacterium]|nr:hypothetical protein [Alphaproteobacteria bacterium]
MKTQRGVTLTDFLAGLALIGVATLGALAGFDWAVNTALARKIYDGVTTRAIAAQTSATVAKAEVGNTVTLGGFAAQSDGVSYTIRRVTSPDSSVQFSIGISSIGNGICRRLLSQNYSIVPLGAVSVNGAKKNGNSPEADDCGDNDTVNLVFYFDAAQVNFPEGCTGDECHPISDDEEDCADGTVWDPYHKRCVSVDSFSTICGECQDGYMCSVQQWAGSQEESSLKARPECKPIETVYVQGRAGRVYLSATTTMTWWDAMNFCKAANKSAALPAGVASADYDGAWTSEEIGHKASYIQGTSTATDKKTAYHLPLCPTNDCDNQGPCRQVNSQRCEFSDKPDGTQCETQDGENGYCYSGTCQPRCASDASCVNPKVCGDLKVCICPAANNPCKTITDETTCTSANVENGTACHNHGQCSNGTCKLDNCHYLDDEGIIQKANEGSCVFKDSELGNLTTPGVCNNGVCGPISCTANSGCPDLTYCRYQPQDSSSAGTGTCRMLGDRNHGAANYGIFQSAQTMDWWSAANWCAVATAGQEEQGAIVASSALCGAVPSVGVAGCANYTNQLAGWTGSNSGNDGYYLDGSGGYLLRARNNTYSALCGKMCAEGYVLNAGSGTCEACPANTYYKDNECVACPNGSTSQANSRECTCPSGSTWDATAGQCDPPSCLAHADCALCLPGESCGDQVYSSCNTSTHLCTFYTPVAYLQSSGSDPDNKGDAQKGQYIETGLSTADYNHVEAKFANTDTSKRRCYVFGVDGGDVVGTTRSQFSFSKTPFIGWGGKTNYCSTTSCVSNWNVDTADHTMIMALKTFLVDYATVWTSSADYVEDNRYTAVLFANKAAATVKQYANVKIYWVKMLWDSTLKGYFLPALDSSGQPGMFDAVTRTMFYKGSQSTGDFTYPAP